MRKQLNCYIYVYMGYICSIKPCKSIYEFHIYIFSLYIVVFMHYAFYIYYFVIFYRYYLISQSLKFNSARLLK